MRFNNKTVVLNKNEAVKLMQTMNDISNRLLVMQESVSFNQEHVFKYNFMKACHDADILDTNFTYNMQDNLKKN